MTEENNNQTTLGDILKNRRISLGRSIEQLSALTRIHSKTLTALEENNYSDLPARAFTRGFVVSYAKALGLNGDELIKSHMGYLEQKFAERPNKEKGHEGYVFESKELEQNRRWMIIAASTAAFFAIVVLLIFKPQNHKRKEKHKEFTEEALANATPSDDEEGAEGLPVVAPAASVAAQTKTSTAPSPATEHESPIALLGPVSTKNLILEPTSSFKANHTIAITPDFHLPIVISSTPVPTTSTPVPAPSIVNTPIPTPTAVATPKPTASAPSVPAASTQITAATPSPSPTPSNDPLKKGDDLKTNEVKKKVSFEAVEDVWVRYQIDQKQPMLLLLRKGKHLVIKAKEKLVFDTRNTAALKVRTGSKGQYNNLELNAFELGSDGNPAPLEGGVANAPAIPESVPPPKTINP